TYLQKVNKMYHKTRQYIHKYFRDRPEPPLNLRVVPLPKFTIHNIEKKNAHIGFFDTLKKLFVHTYLIKVEDEKVYSFDYGEKKKESFSPLVRVLRYDVDDVVLDNPSMKAIIDFRWKPAKLHFINLFIRFVFHGILYLILCWAYTSGIENS